MYMQTGTIKFFDRNKGFGFIGRDEGEDVYVNANDLAEGSAIPSDGDQVEFEVEESDRGLKAKNAKVIEE